eukprot:4071058-Amphidinium_carterae.1
MPDVDTTMNPLSNFLQRRSTPVTRPRTRSNSFSAIMGTQQGTHEASPNPPSDIQLAQLPSWNYK